MAMPFSPSNLLLKPSSFSYNTITGNPATSLWQTLKVPVTFVSSKLNSVGRQCLPMTMLVYRMSMRVKTATRNATYAGGQHHNLHPNCTRCLLIRFLLSHHPHPPNTKTAENFQDWTHSPSQKAAIQLLPAS